MLERSVTVGWPEGLHARPASVFCRAVTSAGVAVTVRKGDGPPVNAASMLGVLSLGAEHGDEIVLASEQEGAQGALERLVKLVSDGLEELPETV
ncbi:MAG TPA: HPr family phosphocarrier protein [Streptomyces sp.]|jgi:phosphocarrier protein|nr:HPr family phosphocarrier protein [Streptomyces sp.]